MIANDTGFQHRNPYRCCHETRRTVTFKDGTADEEIEAFRAELLAKLPGGQTRQVTRRGLSLHAYVFCDSGD